jgi:hypothetical protein
VDKFYLDYIKEKFKDNFDVKYRVIKMRKGNATLVFIDNMTDSKFISEYIVTPLTTNESKQENIEDIKDKILFVNIIGDVKNREDCLIHILSGDVVILFDYMKDVIFCEAKGFSKRSITVPPTEAVIKGPREGFTETFVDNVAMLRRKIKNPDLKFENIVIGDKSNTVLVMSFIKGVAPQKLVDYVREKINTKEYDFILDVNYIEELLQSKKTPYDTIGYSEKPDIVASKLLEGRIAIIVDGSPFVLTMPFFFLECFQTGDDYYLNKYYGNVSRILRWGAFAFATLLIGMYVAITTYHFSLIPQVLVFRLAVSRAGVPFPTVIEVLLMILFFQLIKEAGIRLPQPIGQAMSIVGALILGDAAVGAGLTSQSTVLIVAVGSISYFLIPKLYGGTALWSLILIMFGAFLGLPGFYIGFFMLITHLAGLKSCGYPYLYPLGTLDAYKYKDLIIRGNLKKISKSLFNEGEDE